MADHTIKLNSQRLMNDENGLSAVIQWCIEHMDDGVQLPSPPDMQIVGAEVQFTPLIVYIDNDLMATEFKLKWSDYLA